MLHCAAPHTGGPAVENFVFRNPVKIRFGRGQIAHLAMEIPREARVLLTYGGGSIKANGVYDQVMKALEGYDIRTFGGIEPNPQYATLMHAVELARSERVDFLLAVGGGSVLDGTKFIAAATPFEGDPWTICTDHAPLDAAVPLGAVLTLPATGSEMNRAGVISRGDTDQKLAFFSERLFPRFSILDPEATFSLPPRQVGNGIVDGYTHVMEQYLTYPVGAHLQDRMAEGILQTLLEVGPRTLANPTDYEARASFMWCCTVALNGIVGAGVPQDWSTHAIGHELTLRHGLDHGQTLAIILPAVMESQRESKRAKLLQYAERVFGLRGGSDDERIDQAIALTRDFFESVGLPTRLSGHGILNDPSEYVVRKLESRGVLPLGERGDLDANRIRAIVAASR